MHRMDIRSREQYLKALLGRYLRARKRGKSALLDEYCRNTGMARKSVLRKIAGLLKGESPPRKQRRPVYGKPGRVALETLWEIFDRRCGREIRRVGGRHHRGLHFPAFRPGRFFLRSQAPQAGLSCTGKISPEGSTHNLGFDSERHILSTYPT